MGLLDFLLKVGAKTDVLDVGALVHRDFDAGGRHLMNDPNLPNDPRFSPPAPPAAPAQPYAPQGPQAQPPQVPPVQPLQPQVPQQPFAQAPPVAPQGFHPDPSGDATPPGFSDPMQPQILQDTTFPGATVHDQIEKKASIAGRVGLVAAAFAVAGGGAFAVTRALAEPAGAQSPEEAVAQLFEAVDNDDLLGLTEAMLPSEREALIDPTVDLFAELERLEILDADIDLESRTDEAGSDGLDFSVTGLDFTTVVVGEGIVNVRLNAGVVSVSGDIGDLPFGDRAAAEIGEENMSEAIDEEIVDFATEEDAQFTVVEEDGSWYISLWYSVAEAAREEAGEPAPNFGAGVVPAGGDSPEDALQVMMDAAVALDAEGVIAAMDPAEFRALYDYAPLFLDDADAAAADFRQMLADEGIVYSLDRLDLSSSDVRGRTVVSVNGFAASATVEGEAMSIDFDGNCATFIRGSEIDEQCIDDLRDEMSDSQFGDAYIDFVSGSSYGVTVVERDGSWYVSGFPTIIGAYTDLLASLEPQDIEDLTDFFGGSLEDAFELGDPLFGELTGGTDPFGDFEPIIENPSIEEPVFEDFPEDEEGYDPFGADEEASAEIELADEDAALFPSGWVVFASDKDFAYFAGTTGIPAVSYTTGYFDGGPSILVERFDASAEQLNAGMVDAFPYELVEVPGLPAGAMAYDWADVDRAIVIDGFIVSAYFDDDGSAMALLTEQVNAIANR